MSDTNAELAQRLRDLADIAGEIADGSARIDKRREKALKIVAGLRTEARNLDPHPNMRLVVSNTHLPGALDYAPDEPPGAA
ncbi:MAG: hypothetical protein VX529_10650 [Pseudomonadota bacterium]|nr:hypothetical protein [Pseudomonadota bacterium]